MSDEINGTYSVKWSLNDTNVTSGTLSCGGTSKNISLMSYATNDFGGFEVIKKEDGAYECRVR